MTYPQQAGQPLEWRVIGLGTKGKPLVRSGWQAFQVEPE